LSGFLFVQIYPKIVDTLIIELTNQKAYKLLQDMEELNLIRVLKKPVKLSLLRRRIKRKMTNDDIDKQLNELHKEWERDT
jgi:chromosome segregation and condensation protein ScpB